MYTQDEVETLLRLFEDQRVAEEKLEAFCDPIAKNLGFDGVTKVGVFDEEVFFTAEWNGPYQASDSETFYFPAKMLVGTQLQVFQYIKDKREKQADDEYKFKARQREQQERNLLATLKEKYENSAVVR